jgi:hypothetical protein
MIRQILGSARLIIEILLVIAAVVLVYWWNPMNIFGGKATLQPTANMVSEIREIGEMITAEYYGEVLTSIEEVQMDLLEEPGIAMQAEATHEKIMEELINLNNFQFLPLERRLEIGDPEKLLGRRERKRLLVDEIGRSNILEKLLYLGDWEQTSQMVFFEEIMSFIYLKQNDGENTITEPLRESRLRKTLRHWTYSIKVDLLDSDTVVNDLWNSTAFTDDYFASKLSALPRKEAKKKLAMIGRGTVKAGFDFEGLQSHMYYLNEEVNELHIFGLSPKILNADINPWFIPEKGIPGFDLLTYNGKVNFKDSKKVKIYAVQKLKTNAINAGIIQQAEVNGGQTISRLIQLLTGKAVKKVIFHHDEIIDLTKEIKEDRYISYEEAMLFEKTLAVELEKIDSLKAATDDRYNNRKLAETKWNTLTQMLAQLQTCAFELQTVPYNYFSTLWYGIRKDSVIDNEEWITLKNIQEIPHQNKLAALWVKEDTLLLQSQWNDGLFQILKDAIPVGKYTAQTVPLADWNSQAFEMPIKDILFSSDSVKFSQFEMVSERRDSLMHFIGMEKYQPKKWESWITDKDNINTIHQTDSFHNLYADPSKFWVVDKRTPDQLIELNIPINELTYPTLLNLSNNNVPDNNLEIGNHVVFKSSRDFKTDVAQPNRKSDLSQDQRLRLEAYLIQLYTQHKTFHNQDFLTKANRWFAKKIERKSGIMDKFE